MGRLRPADCTPAATLAADTKTLHLPEGSNDISDSKVSSETSVAWNPNPERCEEAGTGSFGPGRMDMQDFAQAIVNSGQYGDATAVQLRPSGALPART